MADRVEAAVDVFPAAFGATEGEGEERWPLGLSVAFVLTSSLLLWLPILAGLHWLFA